MVGRNRVGNAIDYEISQSLNIQRREYIKNLMDAEMASINDSRYKPSEMDTSC